MGTPDENNQNKLNQEQKQSAPVFIRPLIFGVALVVVLGIVGVVFLSLFLRSKIAPLNSINTNSEIVAVNSQPASEKESETPTVVEPVEKDSEEPSEPSVFEQAYEFVTEPHYDEKMLTEVRSVFTEADFLDLNPGDLEVVYEGILINRDSDYNELSEALEEKTGAGLAKGYQNRANKELEFYAYHPGYFQYKIGLDFHNFNAADECLVTIDISGMGTVRGLKQGDSIERVAGLYGRPREVVPYTDKSCQILYGGDGGVLRITTDKTGQFVDEIFIEYACERYSYEESNLEDWQIAYLHKIIESRDSFRKKNAESKSYEVMKYLLCDVNRDYIPELCIYTEKISPDDKITMTFYTFEEGELKCLGDVKTPWKDFYSDDWGLIVSYTGVEEGGGKRTDIFDRISYNLFGQNMEVENLYTGVFRYTDVEKASPGAKKLTEYPIDYVLAVSEYGTKSDTATKKKGDIKLLYDFISQKNGTVYGIDATRGDRVGEMPFVDFVCLMGSRHYGLREPLQYSDVDINMDGQVERIIILDKGIIILNYQDDEVYAYYMTEAHATDLNEYYETSDGRGRAFWTYNFNGKNHYDRFYFNRTEFLKEECGEIRENTVQKLKIEEYKF